MDGFTSVFDGVLQLNAPTFPVAVLQQRIDTSPVVSLSSMVGSMFNSVNDRVKDIIISKAKLSNKITEDLVKRYHAGFMNLYKEAQKQIQELEHQLELFKNPLKDIAPNVFSFQPDPAQANEDIVQYIIIANQEGMSLAEILERDAPHLLPSCE